MDISRLRSLAISDSGFIFDPVTGHTFNVNATGHAILVALKEGLEPPQVVARLREDFELSAQDEPERDVEEFLLHLKNEGLVV